MVAEEVEMNDTSENIEEHEGMTRRARDLTMASLLRSFYLRSRRQIEERQALERPQSRVGYNDIN